MRSSRVYQIAGILLVFAIFAMLYVYMIRTYPPETPEYARDLVIELAVAAALWSAAVRLLVRHWWTATGARLSMMDSPGRLLTTAVAVLPEHRRDWGSAMLAELPEVEGTWRRWRFALSCVRVAALPPPAAGWPLTALVVGVAAAAVTAAQRIAVAALPALEVFAVTFVALVGLLAVLGALRTSRPRLRAPVPAAIMVAGVGAAVVAMTRFLLHYPTSAEYLPAAAGVFMAVILAAGLWLALAPPRSLSGELFAPHFGILAALLFGGFIMLAMRADDGMFVASLLTIVGLQAMLFVGFIASAVTRSFRAGVHATAWAVLCSATIIYAAWLPLATRFNEAAGRKVYDAEGIPIGDNLNDAMFVAFVIMPILSIPFGVMGAGFGTWVRGKFSALGGGSRHEDQTASA